MNHPERAIQTQCVRLLRSIGAAVWVMGTTRARGDYQGTRQTPGIPDVMAHLPHATGMLFLECKAPGGRLRPEQQLFRDETVALADAGCKVYHVTGGLNELIATLVALGLVKADGVAHYRRQG